MTTIQSTPNLNERTRQVRGKVEKVKELWEMTKQGVQGTGFTTCAEPFGPNHADKDVVKRHCALSRNPGRLSQIRRHGDCSR
jgi:hypothetical protein